MEGWTPQEVVNAIDGLSLTVIGILALAYCIGKVCEMLKAKWSK